jgi:hypothetical protein
MTLVTEPSTARPNSDLTEAAAELKSRAMRSLFYFCKAELGMKDLQPKLHGDYADFMGSDAHNRRVAMMFRGGLKTSIGTLGKNLQRAIRFLEGDHPLSESVVEYPLLICSSTATNVRRMSRDFARLFEESPVMHWLHPRVRVGPEWSKDCRQLDYLDDLGRLVRRATVDFKGIEARMSSNHYRGITFDDIHAAEEGMDSPPAVGTVVSRYEHSDSLLIEPDKDFIDLVGSPCSLHPPDVYETVKSREADRYLWFVRPCYDKETGQPTWSERFPRHVLEAIRRKEGDVKFSYQYLLDPIDELVAEFRMSDFVRFSILNDGRGPLYITEDRQKYALNSLFAFSIVDLAGWRGEGDSNAILTGGTAADNRHLLLGEFKRRCPPDILIDAIVEHHKRLYTQVVGVEEVAYQECLSYYLEKRIQKDRLALRVIPCKPRGRKKEVRTRSMQPLVRERQILIHDGLPLFTQEASHFPKGENHLLDAFSYLPQVTTVPTNEKLEELEHRQLNDYLRDAGIPQEEMYAEA